MTEFRPLEDGPLDPASVRARLRGGDPYSGPLDGAESARLRQALRTAALERQARRPALGWTLAAASLGAALALVVLHPAPRPSAPGAGQVAAPSPPPDSQLHFVTPGGTRVVWVLRSDDLEL